MNIRSTTNRIDYCRVIGCRFKGSHTWQEHICGLCGEKGHGQIECGNTHEHHNLQNAIKLYGKDDQIKEELWCKSNGCERKKYHTSSSHFCDICRTRGEPISKCYHTIQECKYKEDKKEEVFTHTIECPICREENNVNENNIENLYGIDSKCQICATNEINFLLNKCKHCIMCVQCAKILMKKKESATIDSAGGGSSIMGDGTNDYWDNMNNNVEQFTLNKMGNTPGKIYIKKYGGMGSTIFIKRDDVGQQLEQFFMYQDSWGQYGPETSQVPQLEEFLNGYTELI